MFLKVLCFSKLMYKKKVYWISIVRDVIGIKRSECSGHNLFIKELCISK
jgi:hypothetical protein